MTVSPGRGEHAWLAGTMTLEPAGIRQGGMEFLENRENYGESSKIPAPSGL